MTDDLHPRSRWSLPLVLTAVGALGLLGLSVASLQRVTEEARASARLEARKTTVAIANSLRLAREEVEFDAELEPQAFRIESDRLVVSPELEWLDPPDVGSIEATLPTEARLLVGAARRLEFGGDVTAAIATFRRVAGWSELTPTQRTWVRLQSLHALARAGLPIDERFEEVWNELDATGPSHPLNIVGLIGLAALTEPAPPPWLSAALIRVPPSLLPTIWESWPPSWQPLRREAEAHVANVLARREVLRTARAWHRSATRSDWSCLGDRIVMFRATDATSSGHSGVGVVVPISHAYGMLSSRAFGHDRAEIDREVEPIFGGEAEAVVARDEGIAVLPGITLRPRPAGDPGQPLALVGIAVALVALFGAGLWLAGRAMRRERAAIRERVDFLTAVTHELKTPLASIRLHVEVLSQMRLDSAQRQRYLARLAAEERRVTLLVENLLEASSIERGTRGYDRRPVAIGEVVTEVVEGYSPMARRDGLEIETRLERPEAIIDIDRGAFDQVLLNLLENVRRYASEGGSCRVVGVVDGNGYELQISDRGPGIPARDRERIFGKFERGTGVANEANPGVGLGLFLARRIVRDLGGELSYRDRVDGPGATFVVRLPLGSEAGATSEKESRRA